MLVLTRRVGESIMVGDDVVISVLAVSGNQVRLGASAPTEIPIHREEIYNRILQEKKIVESGLHFSANDDQVK